MLKSNQVEQEKHLTNCQCDNCKVHGVCKLEEFITYNLDTIRIPDGLAIKCDYYTGKVEPQYR